VEALSLLQWLIDGLIGIGLLWLAWRALFCPELFKAIVLFIAFGLLMTLAWVRLKAPDVALAEVAIGAGLTGALLLSAWAKLRDFNVRKGTEVREESMTLSEQKMKRPFFVWLSAIPLLLMAVGLGYGVLQLHALRDGVKCRGC